MVDEQPVADLGPGVDFDAGKAPAPLADHPGQEKVLFLVQPVADPVEDEGVKARIQQHHLGQAAGGGVLVPDVLGVAEQAHGCTS